MARLYDKLISDKCDLISNEHKKILEKCELIVVDNVAKYVYKTAQKDKWCPKKDMPCIAPPFARFFIETKNPNLGEANTPEYWGSQVTTLILGEGKHYAEAKWAMLFTILYQMQLQIYFPEVDYLIVVNEEGQYYGEYGLDENGEKFCGWEEGRNERNFILPFLVAISFMHIKNIGYIERDYPEPVKRKREKRYGKPLKKYKVLDINPAKKVLQTEGNIEKNGLIKALHICRGHFKDYRESGLFGKYKGIYWWDNQVRGNIKSGIVEKQYNINASE
jgi:hypothetical protein